MRDAIPVVSQKPVTSSGWPFCHDEPSRETQGVIVIWPSLLPSLISSVSLKTTYPPLHANNESEGISNTPSVLTATPPGNARAVQRNFTVGVADAGAVADADAVAVGAAVELGSAACDGVELGAEQARHSQNSKRPSDQIHSSPSWFGHPAQRLPRLYPTGQCRAREGEWPGRITRHAPPRPLNSPP